MNLIGQFFLVGSPGYVEQVWKLNKLLEVTEHSFGENHKIFQMLTIFSEYLVHATEDAMQHKKIYSIALFVNREVLKSLKFYPKILTQGMIMDSFT